MKCKNLYISKYVSVNTEVIHVYYTYCVISTNSEIQENFKKCKFVLHTVLTLMFVISTKIQLTVDIWQVKQLTVEFQLC